LFALLSIFISFYKCSLSLFWQFFLLCSWLTHCEPPKAWNRNVVAFYLWSFDSFFFPAIFQHKSVMSSAIKVLIGLNVWPSFFFLLLFVDKFVWIMNDHIDKSWFSASKCFSASTKRHFPQRTWCKCVSRYFLKHFLSCFMFYFSSTFISDCLSSLHWVFNQLRSMSFPWVPEFR